MAAEILKKNLHEMYPKLRIEVYSRGLVVNFPEPMNPKAEAVLHGNEIIVKDYVSKEFIEEEVTDKTLVLALDQEVLEVLIEKYTILTEENTFVLAFFVGEELETLDPYGEPIVKYGLCYEALKETTKNLLLKMKGESKNE
jgi:protein-tyrosine phosphatase